VDRNQTFDQVLRLEPGRTALLVVDMQRGFLDPGEAMEVPPAREIIPRINREYRVVVVEDAVAALWPETQRATLDIFRRAFARVVSAEEVADELALW
jgi:nicotinamidase-related amidase